jgi:hypothetical protein
VQLVGHGYRRSSRSRGVGELVLQVPVVYAVVAVAVPVAEKLVDMLSDSEMLSDTEASAELWLGVNVEVEDEIETEDD